MAEETPKIPQFPGGPDPTKPVPRDAVSGVDLEGYATLSARLAETRERGATLAAAGLTETAWMRVEQTWMLRIGVSMMQGDRSLALDYDRLYVAAQDALGPAAPARTLAEYAAIVAALEAGREPASVIAAAGLSLPDWGRLQRTWTARVARDESAAAELRAMVKACAGASGRTRPGD